MAPKKNRYTKLIEQVFLLHYKEGATEVPFYRSDIEDIAKQLGIQLPKNLGDIIYSFRYRANLPDAITDKVNEGFEWIIRPTGRGSYKFELSKIASFIPNTLLVKTKIPDATPGIVSKYALNDEQALLAKLRYNRLIDIFTGVTCYSLQNHLRTTIKGLGQVETDEIYIGIDKQGVHYIFTVEAKERKDRIGVIQIEQDLAVCAEKFSDAIGRPIAAQHLDDGTIVLFEFAQTEDGIRIVSEKHYLLVSPDKLSTEDLEEYRKRTIL